MADPEPQLTAFSVKALGLTWLGMAAFGCVNFVAFMLLSRLGGMLLGSLYLLASLIVAVFTFTAGHRAFGTGIALGFTIMTLIDGTCTLFVPTPAYFGFLNAFDGLVLYSGVLLLAGVLVAIRAFFAWWATY